MTNFCVAAVIAVSINTIWTSPAKAQWDPACPHQHARPATPQEPNTRCVYHTFNPYNATASVEDAQKAFKGKKDDFDPTKVNINIFGSVPWVNKLVKVKKDATAKVGGIFGGATSSAKVGQGVNASMGSVAGAMKK